MTCYSKGASSLILNWDVYLSLHIILGQIVFGLVIAYLSSQHLDVGRLNVVLLNDTHASGRSRTHDP